MGNKEVTIIVLVLCAIIFALSAYFSFGRKKNHDSH